MSNKNYNMCLIHTLPPIPLVRVPLTNAKHVKLAHDIWETTFSLLENQN